MWDFNSHLIYTNNLWLFLTCSDLFGSSWFLVSVDFDYGLFIPNLFHFGFFMFDTGYSGLIWEKRTHTSFCFILLLFGFVPLHRVPYVMHEAGVRLLRIWVLLPSCCLVVKCSIPIRVGIIPLFVSSTVMPFRVDF
jgi:hypothetical protein